MCGLPHNNTLDLSVFYCDMINIRNVGVFGSDIHLCCDNWSSVIEMCLNATKTDLITKSLASVDEIIVCLIACSTDSKY